MASEIKRLRKENNKLDKKLNKEYRNTLTDMMVYIRGSKINEYNQELIYSDLVNMMLEAQNRGEDVRSLIGGDYKNFCDNILMEIEMETPKERVITKIKNGLLYFTVIFLVLLFPKIPRIIDGGISLDSIPLTLGEVAGGLLIVSVAIFIVEYICRTSFEESKTKKFGSFIFLWLVFVAIIGIQVFYRSIALSLSLTTYLIILLVAYTIYKVLDIFLENIMTVNK